MMQLRISKRQPNFRICKVMFYYAMARVKLKLLIAAFMLISYRNFIIEKIENGTWIFDYVCVPTNLPLFLRNWVCC